MISKVKDTPPPTDKPGLAGYEAERQMAYYLRRAFGERPDVYVFNDLRLERNGENAQIDHLIMHRFGFVVIESKSVFGEITVNGRGEFVRHSGRRRQGMQSPIEQAKIQADLLGQLLNDHKDQLRRKMLFGLKQGFFGEERFKILVAISDGGIINREGFDPPELCKADSITAKVQAIITAHERLTGVGGMIKYLTAGPKTSAEIDKDALLPFTYEEQNNLVHFLLHQPSSKSTPTIAAPLCIPEPATMAAPPQMKAAPAGIPTAENLFRCRQCAGTNLLILHGPYGYYFKCQDCQGNTPIDKICKACGGVARISKSGLQFHRSCEACNSKEHFYTNPTSH